MRNIIILLLISTRLLAEPEVFVKVQDKPVKNWIANSSFEKVTNPGVPDSWGTYHWGTWEDLSGANFEQWQKLWGIDKKEQFEGKHSFKITRNGNGKYSFYLTSCQIRLPKGQYVFSAYMKSDKPGAEAVMEILNTGGDRKKEQKIIKLSSEWKRYYIAAELKKHRMMVSVHPKTECSIWIDATQLEAGDKPSAYEPSILDKPLQRVPITYAQTTRAPVINGKLNDPVWQKARKYSLQQIFASPEMKDATRIYLLGDNENLYIGLKCYQGAMDKLEGSTMKRDQPLWRRHDSISIFLCPTSKAFPHYQFLFDWVGNRFDNRSANPDWDSNWQVKTAKHDKFWTAEVVIPWMALMMPNEISSEWRINIGRENNLGREVGVLFPLYNNFHTPRRFGVLKGVPAAYIKDNLLLTERPELEVLAPNTYRLKCKLNNPLQKSRKLEISYEINDNHDRTLARLNKEIKIAPGGKSFITEAFELPPEKKFIRAKSTIRENGNLRVSRTDNFYKENCFEIKLYPDMSYYTGEKNIKLTVCDRSSAKLAEKVTFQLFAGDNTDGKCLWQGINKSELDIAKLANGSYLLCARVFSGEGKELAKILRPFKKLAPADQEVKIDNNSKSMLLNGVTFLPIAVYWENPAIRMPSDKILDEIKALGFNSILAEFRSSAKLELMIDLMNRAQAKDLKVIMGLGVTREPHISRISGVIKQLKKHPALLSWYVVNEPDVHSWNKPEVAEKAYALSKKSDLYHPSFSIYTPNFKFDIDPPSDIISLDHYPVPETDFREIPEMVKGMDRAKKPVWICLQSVGNTYFIYRKPTPGEFRFMTYSSLLNGASGLMYFAQLPKAANMRDEMKIIFPLIKKYSHIFLSERLDCEQIPSFITAARKYREENYLLVLNALDSNNTCKFKVDGTLKELISGKTLKPEKQSISDKFKPFELKIYKIR